MMSDTESSMAQAITQQQEQYELDRRSLANACGNPECICCASGLAKADLLRELGNEMAAQLDEYQETIKKLQAKTNG